VGSREKGLCISYTRRCFRHGQLIGGVGIPEHRHAADGGHGLLEQLQPFPCQFHLLEDNPSDLPTEPRQTGKVPQSNWIIVHRDHHNGDGAGDMPGGAQGCFRTSGEEQVNAKPDQLGRQARQPLKLVRSHGTSLDGQVLSLDIAEVTETLSEGTQGAVVPDSRRRREHAEPRYPPRWLCCGGERYREEA